MKRLERNNYLEKLMAFRDKHIIKIITGIRRCGKSTLMEIYQDALRSRGWQRSRLSPSILRTSIFVPFVSRSSSTPISKRGSHPEKQPMFSG